MADIVRGFLVYHAALREQITLEHYNLPNGKSVPNLISADGKDLAKNLVELFSHNEDWVLDMNSTDG